MVDETEMGYLLVESRECSSSNSCVEEYAWERKGKIKFQGKNLNGKSGHGRNTRVFATECGPCSPQNRRYSSTCDDTDLKNFTNKEKSEGILLISSRYLSFILNVFEALHSTHD